MRVWDVVRTQAEIQDGMSLPLVGNEPGLIGYWGFSEGSGQIAGDKSVNGNDGQLGSTAGADANDPAWTIDVPPGWQHATTISVYNPGTSTLTDYQVRLDVPYLSGMNADFSDVRFKADPEGDFLPYWTESYSESVSAVTWVKVPSLPAESATELVMYYGNATAVEESDGEAVFEFFDDFEGSVIDGGKWSVIGSADRLAVSDGYLDLAVTDNNGASGEIVHGVRAHSSYTVGHSILGRVRDPDGSPDNHISYVGMTTLPACHTFYNCSQKGLTIYQNTNYDFIGDSKDTSREYTENNYGSISDWHTYRIDYAGGSLARFYRDDELRSVHTADDDGNAPPAKAIGWTNFLPRAMELLKLRATAKQRIFPPPGFLLSCSGPGGTRDANLMVSIL